MSLPKKARSGDLFDKVLINVYDLKTKQIVFTGGQCQVASFLNISQSHIFNYIKTKSKFRKKYALRMAKSK